jgi:ribose transport system permease protein
MTLAMMQIANGISALLVRGQIAYTFPDFITVLGSGTIYGLRWSIIVCIIFLVVAHLVLTYTRFGRYVYMVGGNREAAEYSGVNVRLIIASVMIISAVCSGIAGMLGVAYFGSAQQNGFDDFLLTAIAAVVVGGTSLFGGRGGIGNTIIGLLVLGVLNNGLDLINIDSFLKILIRGLILLAALVINVYAQKLKESAT